MPESKNDESYLKRFKDQFMGVKQVINALIVKYDGLAPGNVMGSQPMMSEMLKGLLQFAEGQFNFFYHGFRGGNKDLGIPKLYPEISREDSTIEYPPEHVLSVTLYQIIADLTTIQLAAEQRILAQHDESQKMAKAAATGQEKEKNLILDLLDFADQRVKEALWPRVHFYGTQPKSQPLHALCYLTDSVTIRITPYTEYALIGIPYTDSSDLRRLLAIPHEVGHMRFWFPILANNAQLNLLGMEADEQKPILLNIREMYYPFSAVPPKPNWSEEVFADVYAVYISGAMSIFSAMDKALEYGSNKFATLDQDDPHPTPLIRPLLMIKAFSSMILPLTVGGEPLWTESIGDHPKKQVRQGFLDEMNKNTRELFNHWKRLLKERNILSFEEDPANPDDSKDIVDQFVDPKLGAGVAEIVDWGSRYINQNFAAERLVQSALYALSNTFGPDSPFRNRRWTDLDERDANPTELPDATQVGPQPIPTEPNADSENSAQSGETALDLWHTWISRKRYFDEVPLDPEKEIYAGKYDKVMHPRGRPSNTWLPIFGAGGWTTEGPCAHPPP